jgi:hypothetical protein
VFLAASLALLLGVLSVSVFGKPASGANLLSEEFT